MLECRVNIFTPGTEAFVNSIPDTPKWGGIMGLVVNHINKSGSSSAVSLRGLSREGEHLNGRVSMLVRRLTGDDLDALWMIRLQALRDSPKAFGSTYEETVARGKESFRQRLGQGNDMFYLGAFDGPLIGIVGFFREEGIKNRHKGYVVSMYVLPERRGQGVGKALVQELVARAKQIAGLEQLLLAVVTTNRTASQLYRSLGFEVYGTQPQALKAGESYWDEDLMILHLH
jgi:ribosomal protein S18 acetylase RimI-like enzyme